MTARDVPEDNKVIYDFEWDSEFPEKNPKATVSLKNSENYLDANRNTLRNQSFTDFNLVNNVNPLLLPNGRHQFKNDSIEDSFEVFAKVSAIVFFVGMFFGIIGLFYRCPLMTDFGFYDFYY